MLRMAENFLNGSLLHNFSFVHNQHTICNFCNYTQIVRNKHHTHLPFLLKLEAWTVIVRLSISIPDSVAEIVAGNLELQP